MERIDKSILISEKIKECLVNNERSIAWLAGKKTRKYITLYKILVEHTYAITDKLLVRINEVLSSECKGWDVVSYEDIK